MLFEEPKMEFVPVEKNDIITESPSTGPEIHICGGESFDDDCNPNKVGSL